MSLCHSSARHLLAGRSLSTLRPTQTARLAASLSITSRLGTRREFSISAPTRAAMEPVFSPKAVTPIGPYSQAIKANGFVFVSGQIPAEPTGKLIEGTVAEKTHKMCQNAKAVLEAAGSGLDQVVKITVYFKSMDDFKEMNEVYAEYFPHKPARSSCEAVRLPAGASIEMDIIALQ
ncbi:endoribonuclease l-PSP domain-containing [Fusarium albosuccineum]|uniref:Endoribonuclease l-PSP domain-containing n=1 Tax=Fusarium albosuccineum TaxID=1237068 RepID=A0A8H4PFW5_9HYPO|nr:endoribonuclease l-PSP domain-containing [Fusarium albosuccineum]